AVANTARFQQLVEGGLPRAALADLLAPRQAPKLPTVGKRLKMWRWRTKDIIRADRVRLAAEKEQRRIKDMSLLCRLPSGVPSLSCILSEIGSPSAFHLARAMHVTTETAAKWIEEDQAPHAVMLALFWLTRWGVRQRLRDAGVHEEDRALLLGHAIEGMPQHYATATVARLVEAANKVQHTVDRTTLLRVVDGEAQSARVTQGLTLRRGEVSAP
ncbi:MAG: hypothetical protein ABIU58_13125, partial [Ramlibacter sp.]